jgi:hypothetical protein
MFNKGESGNKSGRPKTAHLDTAERLQKTQKMMVDGTEFLASVWGEVVQSMYAQAKRGNVPAATWLRDTFIGKPSETINHAGKIESENQLILSYSLPEKQKE